jgi:tetratricopeptide (TPR) repeat protein
MILRDEAFFLARCLDAMQGQVDEIILVDTGSTDGTLEICRRYTDSVYEFTWVDDFALARNYALEQATGDWIMVLDADEMVSADDMAYLRGLLAEPQADAFALNQLNYSDNSTVRDWQPQQGVHPYGWAYKGYQSNSVVRLFRNREELRFTGKVHEIIDLRDESIPVMQLEVPIHHDMSGNPDKERSERQRNYLRIMEEALRQQPDGRLAARSGAVRMYELQDYRGAISHLQQAVELDYDREVNLEAIGEAHYRLGEHELALEAFGNLYNDGHATASLCNNYSNLLVKANDLDKAIEVLQRALSLGALAPERIERIRHNIAYLKRELKSQLKTDG